ncbi:MAG: glycosyltransferase, partial [Candidatus Omnitrophica bacterium]|nr:glycosyltransferase [Candidatus Omnitrophota bacterium]
LPTFWGLCYYITDNFFVNLVVSKIRRISNWLNSKKLAKYLLETKPDVIISTHFFPSEVISDMKASGVLKSHLVTVVTDYRLHSWWVCDCTDTYVVASREARDDLIRWKVDPAKIKIAGIPIEPVFSKKLDKAKTMEKLGLKSGIFTILAIGGGFGVGPIEDIVRATNEISEPVQVVAICGHNDELVKKLNSLAPTLKIHLNVLSFVDNVYEYMDAADILISKSGGITVSESLAKEVPMVIISPIMGQETRNSDFLITNGAAIKIDRPSELKSILEEIIRNPEKMDKMKDAIRTVKKPAACYDVARIAIDLC